MEKYPARVCQSASGAAMLPFPMKPHPLLLAAALFACALARADSGDVLPAAPVIPPRRFELRAFGAKGDGTRLDTEPFRRALAAVDQAGGGILEVPAGDYLTGPLSLCSSLELRFAPGATLWFTPDPAAYGRSRGRMTQMSADGCHDILISGPGTLDGHGEAWWPAARARRDPLTGKQFPGGTTRRPSLLVFNRCQRVRVEGVTLRHSPGLNLGASGTGDLAVEDVTILNPPDSPNTDGIDPKSCQRVLISHCRVDTGDDCVAAGGSASAGPERDVLVTDCTFLHGHGCSIGSGTSSGVTGFVVRRCTFDGTTTGIRLKSARDRGGLVRNLVFEDLEMRNVGQALSIDSHYEGTTVEVMPPDRDQAAPRSATTPQWRDIVFRNLRARDCTTAAGLVVGLPEMPIENLIMEKVRISAPTGLRLAYVRNVVLKDVQIDAKDGTTVISDDTVRNLIIRN